MLNRTKGDLLDLAEAGEFDIIVHGCNCFNVMGGGIARQIKYRYPCAFAADAQVENGIDKLGTYSLAPNDTGNIKFVIVNAYTQYMYGRTAATPDLFEYASFDIILKKLAHKFGKYQFGFPEIGMGLAGGDPKRIIPMLEQFATMVEAQGGAVTMVTYSK